MTHSAGERLFEAIGQLPEEMILEAEQDGTAEESREPDTVIWPHEKTEILEKKQHRKQHKKHLKGLAGCLDRYFQYIPIAVCLCVIFGSAYFILDEFYDINSSAGFSISGSSGTSGNGTEGRGDTAMLDDRGLAGSSGLDEQKDDAAQRPLNSLPVRYDSYEGPIIALTATGDTQKIKTGRTLKGTVTAEEYGGAVQPLLNVTDIYRIKNTSKEDKTLQLVYPFAATLNLAYDLKGELLKVKGLDTLAVTYGIGDSVSIFQDQKLQDQNPDEASEIDDYERLFDDAGDYQERALEKAADWSREVSVYTLSHISVQKERAALNNPGVVSVTVNGADADVLTWGFDHSMKIEEGISRYCVIASAEQGQIMLIVTGEQEGEPEIGYYSNLDCEERIEGITCTMQKQRMSYTDALRWCSAAAEKQITKEYEEGVYAGELPEYFDADAAYRALTIIEGEEAFYDTLVQRCQSTELMEIYEKIFGEMRIIYAMAAVSIPPGKTIKVIARTQKRQCNGHYSLAEGRTEEKQDYAYDLLLSAVSRLNVKKTSFQLALPKGWQLIDNDLGLKCKKNVWKGKLKNSEGGTVTIEIKD